MIGKIPTWWENSVLRNRNMIGKIPTWWENSVRGRKKVFRCMDHLVLRHPSYKRGFTFPFSLSVQSFTSFKVVLLCFMKVYSKSRCGLFVDKDGILGYHLKKIQAFCSMQFTVPSTGGCYRKQYSTLGLKIHTKKSAKQENSSLFLNSICRTEKRGQKPDKNLSLSRHEFKPRNLD